MKLTIIETGLPPLAIRDKYPGGYPVMFERLMHEADPEMTFDTISVDHGRSLWRL